MAINNSGDGLKTGPPHLAGKYVQVNFWIDLVMAGGQAVHSLSRNLAR